ncbi:hypothetical protein IE077_004144 [Cardiosporidium cionae]|uniref:RRM domain-containing protein n=1 Tax=Cardiosporidium cionae TaxID=476202 RepID=A0ABQ7JE44_9APIC|nr:hypothetical protein IE077_004144 [Cardiosporidium cionae]|eukprot:KAF8822268.1 hypothetical protein IE077_004144 [Cardiosporidium cionae]
MGSATANEIQLGLSEISSQDELSDAGKLKDTTEDDGNRSVGMDRIPLKSKDSEKDKCLSDEISPSNVGNSVNRDPTHSSSNEHKERKKSHRDNSRVHSRSARQPDEFSNTYGARPIPQSHSPYRSGDTAQEESPLTSRRDRSREGHYHRAYGPSKTYNRRRNEEGTRRRRSREQETSSISSRDRYKRSRKELPWRNQGGGSSLLVNRVGVSSTMETVSNSSRDETRPQTANSHDRNISMKDRPPISQEEGGEQLHEEAKPHMRRKFESTENNRRHEILDGDTDPYSTSSPTVNPAAGGVIENRGGGSFERTFLDQIISERIPFRASVNELQRSKLNKVEFNPTGVDESVERWSGDDIEISEGDRYEGEDALHVEGRLTIADDSVEVERNRHVWYGQNFPGHSYQKTLQGEPDDVSYNDAILPYGDASFHQAKEGSPIGMAGNLLSPVSPRNDHAHAGKRNDSLNFSYGLPHLRRFPQHSFHPNRGHDPGMVNPDDPPALPLYDTYAGLGGVRLTPAPARPIPRSHLPPRFPHILGPMPSTRTLPTSTLRHTLGPLNTSGILPHPNPSLDPRIIRRYETPSFQPHPQQMQLPRDAISPWEFYTDSLMPSREQEWQKSPPEGRMSVRVNDNEVLRRRPPLGAMIARPLLPDSGSHADISIPFGEASVRRESSTEKTIMLSRLPPELCTLDALNSYFKMFGVIQDIRCERAQHCAFIEFFDASSANQSLQSEPFGLSHIGVMLVQNRSNLPIRDLHPVLASSAPTAESAAPVVQKMPSQPQNKFESEEYLKKKEQQLQNERLKETLDQKQNNLLKKLTKRLQETIAASTAASIPEEKKSHYAQVIRKLRAQLEELNESINASKYPKKSAEEMRLEEKLANLERVAAREGVDTKKVLSAALKSHPYKLDYRTSYVKVSDIPEAITDQETLSEWVALHNDSLFGNAIDVFSLERDSDGLIFCCIKYISRHSAEQVMNEREKLDFSLEWLEVGPHDRTILSEANSKSVSHIATHVEDSGHPPSLVDEVETNAIVEDIGASACHFDHHETEVDYGDDV